MKPTYTKLAADGSALPADHPNDGPDRHLAVRVEHDGFPGWSIVVSAYRCEGKHSFAKAQEVAAAHAAYGWKWRNGSPEELFLINDRTDPSNSLPKEFFPDSVDYEWTWTNLVDASSPAGSAWDVSLGDGDSNWNSQSYRYHVRPVLAGQ